MKRTLLLIGIALIFTAMLHAEGNKDKSSWSYQSMSGEIQMDSGRPYLEHGGNRVYLIISSAKMPGLQVRKGETIQVSGYVKASLPKGGYRNIPSGSKYIHVIVAQHNGTSYRKKGW